MSIINKIVVAGVLTLSLSSLVSADEFYWDNVFDLSDTQSSEKVVVDVASDAGSYYETWWKHYSE